MAQQRPELEDIDIDLSDLPDKPIEEEIDLSDLPDGPDKIETAPVQEELTDLPETEPELVDIPEPEQKSGIRKAWDTITSPLVNVGENVPFNAIDEPTLERSPAEARVRGFIAGAGRGLVDTLSSLTSPLNIATPALFGGAKVLPGTAGRLSNIAGRGLSAGVTAEGADRVLTGETIPEKIAGGLEVAGGLAGMSTKFPVTKTNKIKTELPDGKIPPSETITVNDIQEKVAPNKPKLILHNDGTFSPESQPNAKYKIDTLEKVGDDTPDLPEPEKLSVAKEIALLPRAIQSAYDLSFPFRQGIGLIHTKGWWNSWDDMLKSVGSEKAYQGVMDSISEHPNFKRVLNEQGIPSKSLAERAGLAVTDLKGLTNREEHVMSTWAEKIPGIRASNRGYTAFANKLRADNFNSLVDQAKKLGLDPETDEILSKQIANYVNNASGRGSLGALEKSATELNALLFSPRLIASRLQMMNRKNYVGQNDPLVRKQYLKSMLATAGAWTTMAGLGALAGADVSLDPNSSDFGKIKIGNTRLDPAGGFQQYLVLLSKLASQSKTSSTTGKNKSYGQFNTGTWGDDVTTFIKNKLAPIPSYVARASTAKDYAPFEVGDETLRMFTPIILQDLSELAQEDPSLIPIALPASGVGIGSQTYGGEEKGKPTRLIPESTGIFPRRFDIRLPRE